MENEKERLQEEVRQLSKTDDYQRRRIQWLLHENSVLRDQLMEEFAEIEFLEGRIKRLERALKVQSDNEMFYLQHPEMD